MKAEFLQNIKAGDAPLPKEVIDIILAENQRDVEAAVKPFADYASIKEQLAAAKEGLKKNSGYLFETDETPPPYAAGTGTGGKPDGAAFNFGFTGVRAPVNQTK